MISIITSLYMSEQHLPGFLKVVRKASNDFDESGILHEFIILPNDPSQIEIELLETIALENKNIVILKREKESLYSTWNFGVSQAKYKAITSVIYVPAPFAADAIQEALSKINTDESVIAYFPFIYKRYLKLFSVDFLVKRKIIDPPQFDRERFLKEMHIGPFFLITKKTFEKNGKFDETFKIAGDYEWSTRAARNNTPFLKINVIAGVFKNNGQSLSGKKDTRQTHENKRVLNEIK